MLKFIKTVPVLAVSTLTLVGILMHDMHIDKATSVALLAPTGVASTGTAAADKVVISQNYHTHVERASLPKINTSGFRSTLPNIQPPRDDDRRYIQNKKLMYMGGGDAMSLWPSV